MELSQLIDIAVDELEQEFLTLETVSEDLKMLYLKNDNEVRSVIVRAAEFGALLLGPVGALAGAATTTILSVIVGAASGGAAGNSIGKVVDESVVGQFRSDILLVFIAIFPHVLFAARTVLPLFNSSFEVVGNGCGYMPSQRLPFPGSEERNSN